MTIGVLLTVLRNYPYFCNAFRCLRHEEVGPGSPPFCRLRRGTEGAMRRTDDEILMRRYLLGSLPQDERTSLEGGYLADAGLFEELVAAENDLIDYYVREV